MDMNFYSELIRKFYLICDPIKMRLNEFSKVLPENWFYELVYCLCTPQSKAAHAMIVQKKFEESDFFNYPYNPAPILLDKTNYIRFHNQKAINILLAHQNFYDIDKCLKSSTDTYTKRIWLSKNVRGLGLKESSHFLRNIGFKNVAILDRHILKQLYGYGVIDEIKKISSTSQYFEIEKKFLNFSNQIGISMDELDLLFWSNETGEILK
ncbi:MAG: DNA lyase [Candidatus Kapabacteria bacterium]|nr:DNA lyase [Candidatus Kapabacteria bacterium]